MRIRLDERLRRFVRLFRRLNLFRKLIMNVLWFSNYGKCNSFSRISENVLPLLLPQCNVLSCILPPREYTGPVHLPKAIKVFHVGDPVEGNEGSLFTMEEFLSVIPPEQQTPETMKLLRMKFALIAICNIIQTLKITHFIAVGGDTVMECLMKMINQRRSLFGCSICIWTPWDYVPNINSVHNILTADRVLTMNPEVIKAFNKSAERSSPQTIFDIEWVGHGASQFKAVSRKKAIKTISNQLGIVIKKKDIVFLNANDSIPRKNLDLTLNAFAEIHKKRRNTRLWLHTNTQCALFKTIIEKWSHLVNTQRIIVTHNKVSNEILLSLIHI